MMSEMMKQCCSAEGKPDFDKMKHFMEQCGKHEFNDEEVDMMKGFCGQEGMPDMAKMKELMEQYVRESSSENFIDEIEVWARRALAANGFGDY